MKDTNVYPDVELHEENGQTPENKDKLVGAANDLNPRKRNAPTVA